MTRCVAGGGRSQSWCRPGPPWRVGVEDGRRTWTYGRDRYRRFGRARTEDLVLRFDDGGKVVSYTFNTTGHDE